MFFDNLVVILLLFALHGIFAMAEIALMLARRTRLENDAAAGDRRARRVLKFINSPHSLMSSLQTLMTFIGVSASIFSVACLFDPIFAFFMGLGIAAVFSKFAAYTFIAFFTSFLWLIVGELIPKKLATAYPESIAKSLSVILEITARLMTPVVGFVDCSGKALQLLFGYTQKPQADITEGDIRDLISKGSEIGVIEKEEENIVSKVFRLGDRPAHSIMTPRQDLVWIDINDPIEKVWKDVTESEYTYFPLADGTIEKIIGIISTKDLSTHMLQKDGKDLRSLAWEPLRIPYNSSALQVLEMFKQHHVHIALVIDEFGGIDGLITVHDLMEAIVGELNDGDEADSELIKRGDGSYLVDASMDIDDLFLLLSIPIYNHPDRSGYHSLGGFIMKNLDRMPSIGEKFEFSGHIFEVVEMDKHRVARIAIAKKAGAQKAA